MGRKRRRSVEKVVVPEEEEEPEPEAERGKKRHKKTKHKKKRAKGEVVEEEEEEEVKPTVRATKKPLTLKIKFGNEVLTTDCKSQSVLEDVSSSLGDSGSLKSSQVTTPVDEWGNGGGCGGSDDISVGEESLPASGELEGEGEEEEEAWLDALETGGVDDTGYLPQKKNPKLLTTRQRALMGSEEVEHLELPLKARKKEESEEMILKKTERNRKRRIQAIKRREKHKAETVHKLLHKQTNKKSEDDKHRSSTKVVGPHLHYLDSATGGVTISLTDGLSYPVQPSTIPKAPLPALCTIKGCSNTKRYSDSVTKLPLCSLECYRTLQQRRQQSHTILPVS